MLENNNYSKNYYQMFPQNFHIVNINQNLIFAQFKLHIMLHNILEYL